jgi:hypothetical protein
MHNHDILIRLRYALDIKNTEMVEIFNLGGIKTTKEEVLKMLVKTKDSYYDDEYDAEEEEEIVELPAEIRLFFEHLNSPLAEIQDFYISSNYENKHWLPGYRNSVSGYC